MTQTEASPSSQKANAATNEQALSAGLAEEFGPRNVPGHLARQAIQAIDLAIAFVQTFQRRSVLPDPRRLTQLQVAAAGASEDPTR